MSDESEESWLRVASAAGTVMQEYLQRIAELEREVIQLRATVRELQGVNPRKRASWEDINGVEGGT
jgi:hypothetical protein